MLPPPETALGARNLALVQEIAGECLGAAWRKHILLVGPRGSGLERVADAVQRRLKQGGVDCCLHLNLAAFNANECQFLAQANARLGAPRDWSWASVDSARAGFEQLLDERLARGRTLLRVSGVHRAQVAANHLGDLLRFLAGSFSREGLLVLSSSEVEDVDADGTCSGYLQDISRHFVHPLEPSDLAERLQAHCGTSTEDDDPATAFAREFLERVGGGVEVAEAGERVLRATGTGIDDPRFGLELARHHNAHAQSLWDYAKRPLRKEFLLCTSEPGHLVSPGLAYHLRGFLLAERDGGLVLRNVWMRHWLDQRYADLNAQVDTHAETASRSLANGAFELTRQRVQAMASSTAATYLATGAALGLAILASKYQDAAALLGPLEAELSLECADALREADRLLRLPSEARLREAPRDFWRWWTVEESRAEWHRRRGADRDAFRDWASLAEVGLQRLHIAARGPQRRAERVPPAAIEAYNSDLVSTFGNEVERVAALPERPEGGFQALLLCRALLPGVRARLPLDAFNVHFKARNDVLHNHALPRPDTVDQAARRAREVAQVAVQLECPSPITSPTDAIETLARAANGSSVPPLRGGLATPPPPPESS